MWKNKKVLVTGGNGFVGSNLIERLRDMGANVTATLHNKDNKRINSVVYEYGSLVQEDFCDIVTRDQDFVFHCAAITHGAAFMEKNPMALVNDNIVMNVRLLEASHRNKVGKFIFISSSAAYPDTGDKPTEEDDMLKGEPYDKYYPVAHMKRYTENLCYTYSCKLKERMKTLVVRPSNIFGKNDDFNPETSHVTAALIKKVAERQNPIEVWGDGNDVRDIIYINDFVGGILKFASKLYFDTPIFALNIASGKIFTVKQILDMLIKLEGYNPKIVYKSDKPTMIPKRIISTKLAKYILDFEAETDIEDALSKTLYWYKKNDNKQNSI